MIDEFRKLAGIKEDKGELSRLKAAGYMEAPEFSCGSCRSFDSDKSVCLNEKVRAPVHGGRGCCNLFYPADREPASPENWKASKKGMGEAFDASVLGYTSSELSQMDDEERAEALRDSVNRIADLADAVEGAFKGLSTTDRAALKSVAITMAKTARRMAPIK